MFLFEQLVRRELRQKYQGSVLGVAWYLVNPLVLVGAYTLMFGVIAWALTAVNVGVLQIRTLRRTVSVRPAIPACTAA